MYWPLLALAALGYVVYRASQSDDKKNAKVSTTPGTGGGALLASPNIVVRNGVQYVRKVDDLEQKKVGQLLNSYKVRPEPVDLTTPPLAGSVAVVLDKTSTPDPAGLYGVLGVLGKAGAKLGLDEPTTVVALDALDAVLSGQQPDLLMLIAAKPDVALAGCKAPSAYAIWEPETSPIA